ncbi:hypothetical protein CIRG_00041 [Coccidioides immitis RMSCC 2394]|uniref:Uncharacterized protein n=1 Tax=Coccidioides immitis RMSCC 2394 TaxID=404692 RepID=A0A0J6XYS4_COCIT|nr:hypothetical protein CIRG_00041 [Coccidioides immitis RMSCC 2394]
MEIASHLRVRQAETARQIIFNLVKCLNSSHFTTSVTAKCERRFLATMLGHGVWMREATRARLEERGGCERLFSLASHASSANTLRTSQSAGGREDADPQQRTRAAQPLFRAPDDPGLDMG